MTNETGLFGEARKGYVQIATAGVWEEAVRVGDLSGTEIENWLARADPDVAIEVAFEEDGALVGFVGLRVLIDGARDRVAFWRPLIAASVAMQADDARAYTGDWCDRLGTTDPVRRTPAQTVELGVFNEWASAEPVALKLGEQPDLSKGPAWGREGATAPICFEEVWCEPTWIWLARVVSEQDGDGIHRIEENRLRAWVEDVA